MSSNEELEVSWVRKTSPVVIGPNKNMTNMIKMKTTILRDIKLCMAILCSIFGGGVSVVSNYRFLIPRPMWSIPGNLLSSLGRKMDSSYPLPHHITDPFALVMSPPAPLYFPNFDLGHPNGFFLFRSFSFEFFLWNYMCGDIYVILQVMPNANST